MFGGQLINLGDGNLLAVFKQAMQQHPPPILLNTLRVAACFEVDGNRIDAMHLLVGIATAVAD